MAIVQNWLPPSRENWELVCTVFQYFPLVSLFSISRRPTHPWQDVNLACHMCVCVCVCVCVPCDGWDGLANNWGLNKDDSSAMVCRLVSPGQDID